MKLIPLVSPILPSIKTFSWGIDLILRSDYGTQRAASNSLPVARDHAASPTKRKKNLECESSLGASGAEPQPKRRKIASPAERVNLLEATSTEIAVLEKILLAKRQREANKLPVGQETPQQQLFWAQLAHLPLDHACKLCPARFNSLLQLLQHNKYVHVAVGKRASYACNECPYSTASSIAFKRHLR